jgi:hypothetical protein
MGLFNGQNMWWSGLEIQGIEVAYDPIVLRIADFIVNVRRGDDGQ